MKLKFKHQAFQSDAAHAVCEVFAGQPHQVSTYRADRGADNSGIQFQELETGYNNWRIALRHEDVLSNIQRIQREHQIEPSKCLEGHYNLTIEMETGTGKTYTYIKTMYELNKRFGWSKFIVVVPSVAIREGVNKSFQITAEHFNEEYSKKIRFFIYQSKDLTKIDQFAQDSGINVMIINSQAFNARGKDARRIYMKLDSFRSRKPIDVIAKTNPILIIDEPQSVEGASTKERLKEFKPLLTLRYSATHKKDAIYNLIYRLDALDAYNQRLVKKIAVKGIAITGTTATESYLYLERINLYTDKSPTATLEIEIKGKQGVRKISKIFHEGDNLFDLSNGLDEYKGYVVARINGLSNTVEFTNGKKLLVGDVVGQVNEEQIRRIQIRETIKSHLERERALLPKGIKVLSLFFIDEVAKYRQYDTAGNPLNGEYAEVFEEEYRSAVDEWSAQIFAKDHVQYLKRLALEKTHEGYFSIDKKSGRLKDSQIQDRKEYLSDDIDAYDLIMKRKEVLLDLKNPVRFIFSHSALREGWDNPNVFQICTLKQSGSDIRKRQEVGRGLRLSVNIHGERMDDSVLGDDVHSINTLTVVANESYESFTKKLQTEIAEVVADRPREVNAQLFENKHMVNSVTNEEKKIDRGFANKISVNLIQQGYVDDSLTLTEKFYEEKKTGSLQFSEELEPFKTDIVKILDTVYQPSMLAPEDARKNNVEAMPSQQKLQMKEFKELWKRINIKSAYTVSFDTEELIQKAITEVDGKLRVSPIYYSVAQGEMDQIESKEALLEGLAFKKKFSESSRVESVVNLEVRYDLIGKIVAETGLTRATVGEILKGIQKGIFDQFKKNPEEFMIKASNLINEQKASIIIEHILYNKLEDSYSTDIFTDESIKGKLGGNVMEAQKHLYDYVRYDSQIEQRFAESLDTAKEVAVYVKLPRSFYISTPVGKYNPDWAIAFHEGAVKHIYFVAETKGSLSTLEFRGIEELKIYCAREHFKKISSDNVKYEVVDNYDALMSIIKGD